MNSMVQKKPVRAFVLRMLAGAVVGAVGTLAFLNFVIEPLVDLKRLENLVPISTGIIYVVTGLSVLFGVTAPRAGAHYLNVEDADELREEGGKLRPAALVMVLTGAFLMILVLWEKIGREVSLAASFVCLAGIAFGTWLSARRYDELMRRLSLEASSLTLQLGMLVVGIWATLAELGYVAWLSPLAMMSGLALLLLFTSFVVVGHHGMLKPR